MTLETARSIMPMLLLACVVLLIGLSIGCALWASRDAKRRGKSPLLVFLLVFWLQFPVGLIAWIVFRPELPGSNGAGASGQTEDPDVALKRRANEGQL